MELSSTSFPADGPIPHEYAFGVPDSASHMAFGANRNPHLTWTTPPAGTRSLALICHDPDVPTKPDDVNQEGREVPSDLPRADFFHWVVVDIPADLTEIAAASFAAGVVAHGKAAASGPYRCRQGLNDYTGWFAGDAAMAGDYYGYDGPCPPWNDSIIHHYTFTIFALDVAHCDVSDGFTGGDVRTAIAGHVLAAATLVGTYTLNPRLLG